MKAPSFASKTKQAIRLTIRALSHDGMIFKDRQVSRRGRLRVVFQPTDRGRDIGEDRPAPGPDFVEPVGGDELADIAALGL